MLVHRIGVVMYDIEGDLNTFSLEGLTIARNGVRRLYALSIVPHQSLTPTATSVGTILYGASVVILSLPRLISELYTNTA
jgi:hypothetical protein